MNYAAIKYNDIANGPGIRVSLFVSGCSHYCKGCFNAVAWDYSYGKAFTDVEMSGIIEASKQFYISGLSVLGGEPMDEQNLLAVRDIICDYRKHCQEKTIWLYSGYTFEELICRQSMLTNAQWWAQQYILTNIDVIVDGRFVEDLKDISLQFRGSSNQRIIDSKQSIEKSEIVLYNINKE